VFKKSLLHRLYDLGTRQTISLNTVPLTYSRSGPWGTGYFLTCMNKRTSVHADNPDLPGFRTLSFKVATQSPRGFYRRQVVPVRVGHTRGPYIGFVSNCDASAPTPAFA